MQGRARALPPQCQIIGILETPRENWNILEIIGNNWKKQRNISIFHDFQIIPKVFQAFEDI